VFATRSLWTEVAVRTLSERIARRTGEWRPTPQYIRGLPRRLWLNPHWEGLTPSDWGLPHDLDAIQLDPEQTVKRLAVSFQAKHYRFWRRWFLPDEQESQPAGVLAADSAPRAPTTDAEHGQLVQFVLERMEKAALIRRCALLESKLVAHREPAADEADPKVTEARSAIGKSSTLEEEDAAVATLWPTRLAPSVWATAEPPEGTASLPTSLAAALHTRPADSLGAREADGDAEDGLAPLASFVFTGSEMAKGGPNRRADPDFYLPREDGTACYLCDATFTFFNRRHTCRMCARSVCGACGAKSLVLPRDAVVIREDKEKAARGEPLRVCKECAVRARTDGTTSRVAPGIQ